MKPVKLYEGTLFECQMIQNVLENEGIESQLNHEIIGTRGGNIYRPAGGVIIIVSDDNYDKAKRIVNELKNHVKNKW